MSRAHPDSRLPNGAFAGTAVPNPAAELQAAVALHQAGALDAAEAGYRAVLKRLPKQPDALHLLGVIQHQRGDSAQAVDLIRRALRVNPSNPHAVTNLASALKSLGRLEEAEKTCAAALARLPGNAEILGQLSAIRHARGDAAGAIAALEKALKLVPANAPWRLRLADLLADTESPEAAVAAYQAYLALAPGDVTAHNNMGVALQKLGRVAEAAAAFRIVIEKQPDLPEGHANLADACIGLGDLEEAEAHYRRASALAPAQWRFQLALANLLLERGEFEEGEAICARALAGRPDDAVLLTDTAARLLKGKRVAPAIEILNRALEIDPGLATAYNNLGNAHAEMKRHGEAEAAFRKSMRLDPAATLPRMNLMGMLQKTSQWDDAVAQAYQLRLSPGYTPELCGSRVLHLLKEVADFDGVDAMMGSFWEMADRLSGEENGSAALPLLAMADDEAKLARVAQRVRDRASSLSQEARVRPLPPLPARGPLAGRKLRIGFLSADFRSHSVAKFILPVFRHFDRARFAMSAYSTYPDVEDAVQAEIRGLVDTWRPVSSLSNREIAQQVRDDGIDILIDLGGYTAQPRLPVLSYRAAPIQATWLGWPFTTGMEEIDYFLMDRFTRPASDAWMVEKPLELPGAFACFESFADEPLAPPPFLKNGHITFGTLNASYKFSREVLARWAAVMRAVAGSRMVIVRPEAGSLVYLANIVAEFERNGIARERLDIISNRLGTASHLSYYNLFDLSLDTFPVTGGTTTTDALWMGVPVVTLMGPAYHQRISGAILQHCGLDDLCVASGEDFVRVAVALANDRDRLIALRDGLRDTLRETPLCRVDKFMAGFQDAMTAVARRHLG